MTTKRKLDVAMATTLVVTVVVLLVRASSGAGNVDRWERSLQETPGAARGLLKSLVEAETADKQKRPGRMYLDPAGRPLMVVYPAWVLMARSARGPLPDVFRKRVEGGFAGEQILDVRFTHWAIALKMVAGLYSWEHEDRKLLRRHFARDSEARILSARGYVYDSATDRWMLAFTADGDWVVKQFAELLQSTLARGRYNEMIYVEAVASAPHDDA